MSVVVPLFILALMAFFGLYVWIDLSELIREELAAEVGAGGASPELGLATRDAWGETATVGADTFLEGS